MNRIHADILLGAVAFAVPLCLYLATGGPCLGFDDAAEFVLVARDWSVAHPPGSSAYVALAHFWISLLAPFASAVPAMQALSSLLGAGGSLLAFLALWNMLPAIAPAASPWARRLAALAAALCCALGTTYWQWSNAIEVYSLQAFASGLLLFAIGLKPRGRRSFVLAGLAAGIGLANHHVTMVLLLPAAAALVALLRGTSALLDRRWLWAFGVCAGVAALSIGSMAMRARGVYAFEFDNPDTPSRLWYHLRGGRYSEGLFESGDRMWPRIYFLLGVIARDFKWFLIPMAIGTWSLRRRAFPWVFLAQIALLILLQAGRRSVANMDSYLIAGMLQGCVLVGCGLASLLAFRGATSVLVALLAWQGFLAFPASDRSGFDAADSWIADFDRSAPQRAVVLLSRWEYRTIYEFYRSERGFRPDLVVLSSDIKGTNKDCVGFAYPEFAEALEPEYGAYLARIAEVDPDLVYTDHYKVSRGPMLEAFRALQRKVFEVAARERRPVLLDRVTTAFFLQAGILKQDEIGVFGILFSRGRLPGSPAPAMSGSWWRQRFLAHELCSAQVLDDYYQMITQTAGYYRHIEDPRAEQVGRLAEEVGEAARRYFEKLSFFGWKRRHGR
ncbi:MAG: hypothetical protein Fur0037_09680 [Planctomycetota bacterium]